MGDQSTSDELVEHLDEDGNVLEVVTRARMRRENLRHRSVGIVVLNGRGEVLIHRRAEDKDVWPGQWDLAAGGVIAHGETFEEAAARELAEELGITGAELEFVHEAPYGDHQVRALARYYRVRWDGAIDFPDGEIVEALWVSPGELHRRLSVDGFVPDSRQVAHDLIPGMPDL